MRIPIFNEFTTGNYSTILTRIGILFWPAFIWRNFLENNKSSCCLLQTKWLMKTCIFRNTQIFSSNYMFSFRTAETFFSKKNCQMKAGQYKTHLTNPQSPGAQTIKPGKKSHKNLHCVQWQQLASSWLVGWLRWLWLKNSWKPKVS